MFATSGNAQLAYSSSGAGDPVLLIHAGVTDKRSWRHLTDRLTPDHQVLAYDQRGFGETTYRPEAHSPATDAVAVLDAAGLDRVAVVGCSLGGGVAVELALAHPDRVARLVLIAPDVTGAPWLDEYPEPINTLGQNLDAADDAGDVDEVNRLEAWLWLDGPTAPEGRVGGEARQLFLDMNGLALRNESPGDSIKPDSVWEELSRIASPTLLLVGELDLPDRLDVCAGMADRMPYAQLTTLPGVAHLPHLENDETCLAAITSFLGP
ncbi:MAG TPA: alpha/beta hydrolase [Jatrophihabitantaceae bacterium]|jgi:pimeloyl-ACP methyl ester carboxylesterase